MDFLGALGERLAPAQALPDLTGVGLLVVLGAALAAVFIGPLWGVLRLAVTLVHELGHAFVGVLVGRKFTGFHVRGDMSGAAVTVGKPRGAGRIATTWAGYPAPGVVAAAFAWAAASGWAAATLGASVALLVVALPRVRSLLTFLVLGAAIAVTGGLWWWRDDALQAQFLCGIAIVLLVGGWRHLAAVWPKPRGDRTSDPAVLAQLTGIPRVLWLVSFFAASAACTYAVADAII